jgi:PAS domain S-box-containing protein
MGPEDPARLVSGDASPRRRLLLADDNADMREHLRTLLSEEYDVVAVGDATAALRTAREEPFDLVLTDVMMPKVDSLGLLHGLRSDPRTRMLPVILLSARAGEESRIDGIVAGADDYLVKPFSARELLARVRARIEIARIREEADAATHESEAQLRLITDAMPALIAYVDKDRRYRFNNRAYTDWFGQTPAELRGRHLADVLGEKAYEAVRPSVDAALLGRTVSFEATLNYKDGGPRYVHISYVPDIGERGDVKGYCALITDLSDRKQREDDARFFAELSERMRLARTGEDLLFEVSRALGDYLGVRRSLFVEIDEASDRGIVRRDYHRGVDSVAGEYRISAYSSETRAEMVAGRTVVNNDSREDPRTAASYETTYGPRGERAYVAVPLMRASRWDGACWVSTDEPRNWRPREVAFLETVAERAWNAVEKLRLDASLRESEARFRNMADHAPVMVWVTGADGSCTYLSRSWYEFTGQTMPTGLHLGWLDAAHPDDRGPAGRAFSTASERREPFRIDYRLRRLDGEYRWVNDSAAPRFGASGEFLGYIGSVIDVTERKQRELNAEFLAGISEDLARLTNSDEIMRVVAAKLGMHLGASGCQFAEIDVAGESLSVLRGWTGAGASGMSPAGTYHFAEFLPDDLRVQLSMGKQLIVNDAAGDPRTAASYAHFARIGFGAFVNTPYLSDGRWKASLTVHRRASHVWSAEELELLRDMTHRAWARIERARAEQSLRESEAHLRRASQMKDEFLATLSHELRTPLNAVLGWANMLRTGTLRPSMAERALEALERNARAQAQLVEDLLDVSRIVSGRMQIKSDVVDLAAMVAGALETVGPAAAGKQVSLRMTADPRTELFVTGDVDRLRQVVWNLLSNAIRFTPPGGRVEAELRQAGTEAEIVVSDTGEGIAPDFLPFVFERFRQADSTPTRRHSGLGLGLALVRHLTEAHGGTVTAESAGQGQGATFTIRLPLRQPSGGIPAGETALYREVAPALPASRVLVVDDEPDTRELLSAILEAAGARVTVAASAPEALELLRHQVFDVLLADIAMPDRDGYSLIEDVRRLDGEVARMPAVAVTAYTATADRDRALAAGYDSHLPKPVEPAVLIATVTGVLKRLLS